MTDRLHVAAYLRGMLRANNIKQKDIAIQLGISDAYFSKMLHGDALMDKDTFTYIVKLLGLDEKKIREEYKEDFDYYGAIPSKRLYREPIRRFYY